MATSGSKSVTVTSWDTLKFSWEEESQSIENNTTKISWKLQLISTSDGRIDSSASKDWSVTVNGTKYSGTNTVGIANNTTKTLASGTTTITHNADGTKSFSYSFSQEFGITFGGTSIGTKSGSGTGTLDTIPRKSTLSVADGTLGTAQTLTITEKASAFVHKLYYSCGDSGNVYILGGASATSSTLSLSWTAPLSLAAQNTTGTSVSIKFTLATYNGSTLIGSNTYTKTFAIPASVKPSCTVAVGDPMGYESKYGGYIKGLSKFEVTVAPTLAHGSAIASYSTTANGATYTTQTFTTGVLKSYGTLEIKATVKDKRGRSGTGSVDVTVLNYAIPKISKLTVGRCDKNADGSVVANDKGAYVQVVFSGSVTSLSNKNSAKYTLKYKKSTDSSYTTVNLSDYNNVYSVSNISYVFAADTGASYDVRLEIKDDFKTTIQNTSASTAFTLMHFSKGGTGIGLGKIAEEENLLDIGLPVRFNAPFEDNVLWTGGMLMTSGHTITLSSPVSKQRSGIALVFSAYEDDAAQNHHFETVFVPKYLIAAMPGGGHNCQLATSDFSYIGTKYLYISDNKIVGHDNNNKTGTKNGVTYANNHWVLRYVIGV